MNKIKLNGVVYDFKEMSYDELSDLEEKVISKRDAVVRKMEELKKQYPFLEEL